MKLAHALLLTIPLAALAVTDARDAAACGGCFVPMEESTQVTGHRMILSISQQETTLWDQIQYAGNPSSFAWVLPTKGIVEVGLSSDALFAFVEQATQVQVVPPPLNCPPPPDGCFGGYDEGFGTGAGAGGSTAAASGSSGGVTVVAQATVGPYETVQLSSSDPSALKTWLAMHQYNVPADIGPVIDAYVTEKFNFLALKLIPGQGVDAMRPVRISSQGATPVLPLRMVAAGTGAVTPITLWVLGEGRYEAANSPNATVSPETVVWNWDASSSNLAQVKQSIFKSSNGLAWLTEAARPVASYELTGNLIQVAQINPTASGYGDAMGKGAEMEAQADADKLIGKINPTSLWITRTHAELSRAAFGKDLNLQAAASQAKVSNVIQTLIAIGKTPACPTYDYCNGGGDGFGFGNGAGGAGSGGNGGCAIGHGDETSSMLTGLGVIAAISLLRRRRSR